LTNPARGAKPVFRPSTPEDQAGIAQFLDRVFQIPLTQPVIQPANMHWKYWKPEVAWNGSRSYVLERDGAILAHGAVWPLELLRGGDTISCFGLIDWAADPASAGAGMALTSRMFQLADVVCVVGGSESALRMRRAMGFRPRNRIQVMARPLRPFRQIASQRAWSWKTLARLLRNVAWSSRPLGSPDASWTSMPATPAEAADTISRSASEDHVVFGGTSGLLERLAQCPVVRSALRVVLKDGRPVGYFLLTFAPGQARIAACWLSSSLAADWQELYRLATAEARRDEASNELVTFASTDVQRQALDACGFHARRTEEVLVHDPRHRVPADAHIEFQMIHGDAAFLHDGTPSYLT